MLEAQLLLEPVYFNWINNTITKKDKKKSVIVLRIRYVLMDPPT
jgi:hypothetical protein